MPRIKVLPDRLVNMISAGEVIERPSSVVKELVENALDAGAGRITVEIEKGGRKSIVVRDDGEGMNRHDLLLAVQRHATSKISSSRDLNDLSTLGFRGEALPSIAAVTHMTVMSSNGEESCRLRIDGGVLGNVEPAARTKGTTVEARGLFYNQPARKKFLRTQATELSWIEKYVTGCSLARSDVSFVLSHNGSVLFDLPAGQSVEERLRCRYRLRKDSRYVKSAGSSGETALELIWFPDNRWNRKSHQYCLVNGRMVYAGLISGPVNRSLSGPAGFPLLCCILHVPADEIDVNVHPAKREVRFRKPSVVASTVEKALAKLPGARVDEMYSSSAKVEPHQASRYEDRETRPVEGGLFESAMSVQAPSSGARSRSNGDEFPIVQIGKSYLVTSTDTGIVLIDQHAAHERILFETVLESVKNDSGASSQKLLLPEYVKLDAQERQQLGSYREILNRSGFEFHMEDEALVLTAVPSGTFHGIGALREIIKSISNPENEDMTLQERVAAAAACAGAVKFGDTLSNIEARHLIDQLFSTSDPFHCPHGRPTLIELSYGELEEKFGRV